MRFKADSVLFFFFLFVSSSLELSLQYHTACGNLVIFLDGVGFFFKFDAKPFLSDEISVPIY